MKKFIKANWELPQNVLGLLIKKILRAKPYTEYKGVTVYSWCFGGGLSLGKYIFVPYETIDPQNRVVQAYIKHEYGHTLQSAKLGWFYLLIIGLPSIIWAGCFGWYRKKHNISYYSFYTEKWADELGGVER